jgi:hypothetical protein
MLYKWIVAYLLTRTDVTALIGDRYGVVNAAQTDKHPYLTYQLISHQDGQSLDGIDGLCSARIQFDIYADDPDEALRIAELLAGDKDNPGLNRYSGVHAGIAVQSIFRDDMQDFSESPLFGESDGPFRRLTDYIFWYEEKL